MNDHWKNVLVDGLTQVDILEFYDGMITLEIDEILVTLDLNLNSVF